MELNNLNLMFLAKSLILHLGICVLVLSGSFIISEPDIKPLVNNPIDISRPIVDVELYQLKSQSSAKEQISNMISGDSHTTASKMYESDALGQKDDSIIDSKQKTISEGENSKKKEQEKLKSNLTQKQKLEEKNIQKQKEKVLKEAKEKTEAKAKAEAKEKTDNLKRQQALAEQKGEKVAGSINDKLRLLIKRNWYRPISAKYGMKIILYVQFSRDGRIARVNINQSSGDVAFDRSAIQAMYNIGRIKEIAVLDDDTFRKYFSYQLFTFQPDN